MEVVELLLEAKAEHHFLLAEMEARPQLLLELAVAGVVLVQLLAQLLDFLLLLLQLVTEVGGGFSALAQLVLVHGLLHFEFGLVLTLDGNDL